MRRKSVSGSSFFHYLCEKEEEEVQMMERGKGRDNMTETEDHVDHVDQAVEIFL